MFGKGNLQPGPKGTQNLWLTPFDPKVLGGLRGKVNQYADTTGTILTPRQLPSIKANPTPQIVTLPATTTSAAATTTASPGTTTTPSPTTTFTIPPTTTTTTSTSTTTTTGPPSTSTGMATTTTTPPP